MTADNLLVITRDLQRSCFATTNIFAKHRCTPSFKFSPAPHLTNEGFCIKLSAVFPIRHCIPIVLSSLDSTLPTLGRGKITNKFLG